MPTKDTNPDRSQTRHDVDSRVHENGEAAAKGEVPPAPTVNQPKEVTEHAAAAANGASDQPQDGHNGAAVADDASARAQGGHEPLTPGASQVGRA